jgi:HEPN domain-containing protein
MGIPYRDGRRQAQRDLDLARHAVAAQSFEWAGCAAPQGAEPGLQAVLLKANRSAWGHSVSALRPQLSPPFQAEDSLVAAVKELDNHDLPSRYPHAFH